MAQDKISQMIRQYRLEYNDNYLRLGETGYPGEFSVIDDYRSKDGEVLTAQIAANHVVDACNDYIKEALAFAKGDVDELRRLIDEYVGHTTLSSFDSVNTFLMEKDLKRMKNDLFPLRRALVPFSCILNQNLLARRN